MPAQSPTAGGGHPGEPGFRCLADASTGRVTRPDGDLLVRGDTPAAPGDLLPPGAAAWCPGASS